MKETFQKLFCPFRCFLFLSLSVPAILILFLYLIHFSFLFSFFFFHKYTFWKSRLISGSVSEMIFWVGLNQKRPRISGEGVRGGVDPVNSNIPSYYICILPLAYTAVLYGFCIIPQR